MEGVNRKLWSAPPVIRPLLFPIIFSTFTLIVKMNKLPKALATIAIFLVAACSQQNDLEEAKRKISQLEAELALEKSKNAAKPAPTSAANLAQGQVGRSQTPSEPTKLQESQETANIGKQWNYNASEDKMSGGTTFHASVISSNTVNFGFPYSGEQNATLHLRTAPRYGKDVIFSIEKGQILCHSYEDCTVLVRFDNEKAVTFSAVGAADNSTETIFLRNYDKFVAKMQKAKVVRISTSIYQQGSPIFEFDVSGFKPEKYKPKK